MALNIKFDSTVSGELQAQVPTWLQETIDWVMQQEEPPKPRPPLYEIRKFTISLQGWNKGLASRRTGEGWDFLQLTEILSVMKRPAYGRYAVGYENAFRGNCVFLLSQSRATPSFEDPDFAWSFHESLQRKWIQEFLPDVAEAERLKRLKSQRAEKHKLQLQKQKADRQPKPPKRYAPHYGKPPAPLPPVPPAAPKVHPEPTLDEYQKVAVARHQAMLDYVLNSTVTTDSVCEDNDM